MSGEIIGLSSNFYGGLHLLTRGQIPALFTRTTTFRAVRIWNPSANVKEADHDTR